MIRWNWGFEIARWDRRWGYFAAHIVFSSTGNIYLYLIRVTISFEA